ncbi:MAG TPA: hypothetical protein VEV82_07930 [Actinomycetota bacterium]|nr:hypothetical protein [Actinomycetota bacterium]
MRAKWISYGIGAVALVGAGFYVFIYLYRWEWNRAIMAGVLFIAAEIGLLAALILDRLKRMEGRLNEQNREIYLDSLHDIEKTAPEARRHFAWLTDQDKVGVFVPALMGAGVVISGLAWCVERFAASTARPLLERRLVLKLVPISLPEGGLTGTSPIPVIAPAAPRRDLYKRVFITLLVAVVVAIGIDLLGDLTQDRPDAVVGGTTTVLLDVSVRDIDLGTNTQAANSLWMACHGTVSSTLVELTSVAPGRVALQMEPALGHYSMRRLSGCLEDGTVDGMQASLVD